MMVVRRDWISSRKIGVLSRGVQQPAVIAKVPTTALNSSPQVLLVSDILSLSVVRKSQAPSSGNSTAASRCLRGGKRPARRHRAFARCPYSCYRSLVCLSFLSGSFPSPHRHSVAAALFLSWRRSSRAPWSPLLASLSSFLSSCPPPARHSVRSCNPLSPPAAPVQGRLQGPPAKSKFLAVAVKVAGVDPTTSDSVFTSTRTLPASTKSPRAGAYPNAINNRAKADTIILKMLPA